MEYSSHHISPRTKPHIHAWKQLYGKNYLMWHGPQAQLVVTEPELIKEILNNKDGAYQSVKGMIPAMIASVETMLARWSQHEGNEIELVSICTRNSFNIRFPGVGKIFKSSDDIEGPFKIKDCDNDLE
ncbi:hypothetical protein Vadar_004535 [Vaccinium darrowii]|uniref:Uncharacterized protein n=1 Tax=Vaccinium darrowii TaxID=229202 RepID=A0ACB7XFB2_9ERIC|nr:hypothetical protein Vadar_004535 [Vaccinium darrowii]